MMDGQKGTIRQSSSVIAGILHPGNQTGFVMLNSVASMSGASLESSSSHAVNGLPVIPAVTLCFGKYSSHCFWLKLECYFLCSPGKPPQNSVPKI